MLGYRYGRAKEVFMLEGAVEVIKAWLENEALESLYVHANKALEVLSS